MTKPESDPRGVECWRGHGAARRGYKAGQRGGAATVSSAAPHNTRPPRGTIQHHANPHVTTRRHTSPRVAAHGTHAYALASSMSSRDKSDYARKVHEKAVIEKNVFNIQDAPKLIEALSYAIDIGYRHIDTADLYRVEPEIGRVVKQKISEGIVKREDLFITTKVWQHNHREADVEKSVRASLKRLDMDYVDLVLMHWPMSISVDGVDEKIDYLETYRGLEAVLQKGLTRAIGVSNFNLQQMQRLLANCNVVPVVNQIEINLNLGQKELVEYCQSKGLVVVGFTSFGTMVPGRVISGSPEPKLDNPTMVAIAKKHGKSVTQVALRYLYQRGIATIPKSLTKNRILENASIFDFELDDKDVAEIAKFDIGYRTDVPSFWQEYDNYPFEKIPNPEKEIPLVLRKW
ncbi:1,5-anhydro-D-fructose reductase [Papilio machaon]|uniref:1,5-anhydro-D-fructose reductase n=1 Tax=Papilio machaon TaxID=76193 RepID=A0A0N1PGT3_PAPMA|nr:1,5-anhydro-D-fructose reductase [Papilio machaon]